MFHHFVQSGCNLLPSKFIPIIASDYGLSTPPASLYTNAASESYTNGQSVTSLTDSGTGAKTFTQGTVGNRPTFSISGSVRGVSFDGTNSFMPSASSIADTTGTLIIAFQTGATDFSTRGDQSLFSTADIGTANNWYEVGIDSTGRIYCEFNTGGTKYRARGSTILSLSTKYCFALDFSGTDFWMQVNNVEENPVTYPNSDATTPMQFKWFGNVSGADNIVIGGTVTSAGLVRPFQGLIYTVRLWTGSIL